MRKKYDYFVNGNKMNRKDFMEELKKCCYTVVHTDMITEDIGVDFAELDEKKFNSEMRAINQGIIVVFYDYRKTFSRKEVKQ